MKNQKDWPLALYEIMEEQEGLLGRLTYWFVNALIIASMFSFVVETTPHGKVYKEELHYFEWFLTLAFTVEFICRAIALWHQKERWQSRYTSTLFFMFVDFVAFAPFWLFLWIPTISTNTSFVRVLRLFRVMSRLMKAGKQSEAFGILGRVIKSTWLPLRTCLFLALTLAFISALLIYCAEHVLPASPNPAFSDMAKSLWWSIVTLTTVGYGDTYPVTLLGKIVASVVMLGGVALVALPAGIIAGAFSDAVQEERKERELQTQNTTES